VFNRLTYREGTLASDSVDDCDACSYPDEMGFSSGLPEEKAGRARGAGYTVRRMRAEDAERVAAVHLRVWREAYALFMPASYLAGLDVSQFEQAWRDQLAGSGSPGTCRLVGANPGGDVVALGAAGPSRDEDAPRPWELYAINVLTSEHGSGLAELMMAELVGDRPASLWVIDGNARARAFYRKYDFVADGAIKQNVPAGVAEIRLTRS
jgi:hypothetical protein